MKGNIQKIWKCELLLKAESWQIFDCSGCQTLATSVGNESMKIIFDVNQ